MAKAILKLIHDYWKMNKHFEAKKALSSTLKIPLGDAEKLYKFIMETDPAYYKEIFNVNDYWAK